MYEMRLYDWKGKLRWAFIQGIFLVDPLYEAEFLKQEVRYNTLYKKYDKETVDAMFAKAAKDAEYRTKSYERMARD